MSVYIPGHVIDEARDLRRQGVPLSQLAERLHVEPTTLATLLGDPQWQQVPTDDRDTSCDLWAAERLDAQL